MTDEKNLKNARSVYQTLCAMLDGKEIVYEKHEDDLVVTLTMNGEDIPIQLIIKIDAERELVRLVSPIPVVFGDDKKVDGAIATSQVNYGIADGSFDFDFRQGKIYFRMTSSFKDSLISKELLEYMVGCSCYTIDEYNDKFLLLAKGNLSVKDFLKK